MFALWKKSYEQTRQHIKDQRHYFAKKGLSSQSYGFSNSHVWTIKKAEHQRIDGFELWCWRRLLRVSWTARRSNQSILKEVLELKLQYFALMLGKIEGGGERDNRGSDG